MIHVRNRTPVRGDVAIGALAGRQDMVNWFGGRAHQSALRMTAGTALVCWAESCANVASFTRHVGMRTVKYEAGTEMVK